MPNEFIVKNGLVSKNIVIISGSINVTNVLTGSFTGTSSYAITSSYGLSSNTASYTTSTNVISSSYSSTTITSSYSLTTSYSSASQYCITPSTNSVLLANVVLGTTFNNGLYYSNTTMSLYPILISRDVTVTSIGTYGLPFTNNSTGSFKVLLYNDNGNMCPSTLIVSGVCTSWGVNTGDGWFFSSSVNQNLTGNSIYWLGVIGSGSTVRGLYNATANFNPLLGAQGTTNIPMISYIVTSSANMYTTPPQTCSSAISTYRYITTSQNYLGPGIKVNY